MGAGCAEVNREGMDRRARWSQMMRDSRTSHSVTLCITSFGASSPPRRSLSVIRRLAGLPAREGEECVVEGIKGKEVSRAHRACTVYRRIKVRNKAYTYARANRTSGGPCDIFFSPRVEGINFADIVLQAHRIREFSCAYAYAYAYAYACACVTTRRDVAGG